MSRFYVGMRVALARCDNPRNKGITGTIVSFKENPAGTMLRDGICGFHCNCVVLWDSRGKRAEHTSRLEPLTDSYDVTSWDTCMWKPEHLRVGA